MVGVYSQIFEYSDKIKYQVNLDLDKEVVHVERDEHGAIQRVVKPLYVLQILKITKRTFPMPKKVEEVLMKKVSALRTSNVEMIQHGEEEVKKIIDKNRLVGGEW